MKMAQIQTVERSKTEMNSSGDAAEQIIRFSLEGAEVAAKIVGEGAKGLTLLLVSVLKQEQRTKGKARLTNMIKSGKELKVFTVQQKDLKKFTEQAKKYGVLYNVLREKGNKDGHAPVDIIARAEDASKIQRIMERFEIANVDKAEIITQAEKNIAKKKDKPLSIDELYDQLVKEAEQGGEKPVEELTTPDKPVADKMYDTLVEKPIQKEQVETDDNPFSKKTGSDLPLDNNSQKTSTSIEGKAKKDKPSVRKKLNEAKEKIKRDKTDNASKVIDKPLDSVDVQTPKPKTKPKER